MVAADTLAFYGSLARYEHVHRMETIGVNKDFLLAASGDLSDHQHILKTVEAKATTEYSLDDGCSMTAAAMHSWLTRMMYQRRSKMDPLWNRSARAHLPAAAPTTACFCCAHGPIFTLAC
jgi:20S proteasome subunit beta 7